MDETEKTEGKPRVEVKPHFEITFMDCLKGEGYTGLYNIEGGGICGEFIGKEVPRTGLLKKVFPTKVVFVGQVKPGLNCDTFPGYVRTQGISIDVFRSSELDGIVKVAQKIQDETGVKMTVYKPREQ